MQVCNFIKKNLKNQKQNNGPKRKVALEAKKYEKRTLRVTARTKKRNHKKNVIQNKKGHFKRDENIYSGVLMQETNLEQVYTSQEI